MEGRAALAPEPLPEARERDRAEVGAAIAMVADGFARSVVLCGLHAPQAAAAAMAPAAADRDVDLDLRVSAEGTEIVARHR